MKQITKIKELEGKTISKVLENESSELYIKLTDGSFAVFEIKDITEGYGYSNHIIAIDTWEKDATCHPLVQLGIISLNDYIVAEKEQEAEWARRDSERKEKENAEIEEREAKEFLRLSQKFKS